MGIFRKLKKLGNLHFAQENNPPPPPPPPPNDRRRMRDQVAPSNMNYDQLPRSFFSAVDLARQDAGYDPLPVFAREPIPTDEDSFMHENPENDFFGFDRSRSKSRERTFDRSARPQSRGTPVKFRRRPIPPELLQPRASSPFLFRQQSLPSLPDMQHPQQFQHIPRQQQQFDMMMGQQPVQFFPQFQQPFYPMMNPNVNMQPWFMMQQQQQQQQMYPFF